MDTKELHEYYNKEFDSSKRAIRKCQLSKQYNPRFILQDKVHLKQGYSTRLDATIPINVLLPFYEQHLVIIRPIKNSQEFKKIYGITVEELVSLYENNRVIPLIGNYPLLYSNLEYLDPLLEKEPPSAFRLSYVAENFFFDKGTVLQYENEAMNYLKGRFKKTAEKFRKIPFFNVPLDIEYQLENDSFARYSRLSNFGYNCLAKSIASMDNSTAIYRQLGFFDSILTQPFIFGGFPQLTHKGYDIFQNQEYIVNGEKTKINEKISDIVPFPKEVARILIKKEEKKLKLLFPCQISLSDVLELANDSAFEKARDALSEFDLAVKNKMSKNTILEKKVAIDVVWDEARDAIENINTITKGIKWVHWSLAMGLIGVVSYLFQGYPGLLNLLGAGVSLDKIIKPVNPPPGLGSLPLALYKLEKVVRKTKEKTR